MYQFLDKWFSDAPELTVHTSGSTGKPKELMVSKDKMMQSARMTCEFLQLKPGDTALLCMNLRYIGAMMVVVRALVAGLNLIVCPASGHPLAEVSEPLAFAAMVPAQVIVMVPKMGDAALNMVWNNTHINTRPSTYGMTETLSHIALRRLNGVSASSRYASFPSVHVSLSADNTLQIDAPLVCDAILQTNDIAEIYPDGSFLILGRKDNVINSGGVKIQAEEIERLLRPIISQHFVVTSIPDERLGEAVVLLLENEIDLTKFESAFSKRLTPYSRPRYLYTVAQIPLTDNGKIDRASCRDLAKELFLRARK